MSIAIMQPYLFPYVGYFQLIHASGVFVFYDDVNFINRGWVNRNRILLNGKDHMITMPCIDASQNRLIKDIPVMPDPKVVVKLLTTIRMAYAKAPYFDAVYPLIERILGTIHIDTGRVTVPTSAFPMLSMEMGAITGVTSIADLGISSVLVFCEYLGISRTFRRSSEQYNNRELKKADRLIDICHREGVTHYINAPGGKAIYTKEYYAAKGVALDFLNSRKYEYPQFGGEFVPWLSMIDVLMFNSPEVVNNEMLPAYYLD